MDDGLQKIANTKSREKNSEVLAVHRSLAPAIGPVQADG
jgi:hypothetical protein